MTTVALIMFFASVSGTRAQNEYRTWYFGEYAGIRFEGDSVVPATGSAMRAKEGCAVICDHWSGRPLFYSDGRRIWDSTGSVMENGTGLLSDSSSAQATVIVPIPCDTNRYYVFSNDANASVPDLNRGVHYSIVDMRLNAGRGAVTTKNVPLIAKSTERLAATMNSNGRDYWVVTQELASYAIHAFPITCRGIGTPVISPAEDNLINERYNDRFNDLGSIQISRDGSRLALSAMNTNVIAEFIDVYRFDPATGVASDPINIPFPAYTTEFSPDGSKIYWMDRHRLNQVDLTIHSAGSAIASRATLGRIEGFEASLQLGPDDRIYVSSRDDTMMTVIMSPNLGGAECDVRYRAISTGGRRPMFGLPNNIDSRRFGEDRFCALRSSFALAVDTLCSGGEVSLSNMSVGSTGGVRWEFPGGVPSTWTGPDPPPVAYASAGRYALTQIAAADRCHSIAYDTTMQYINVLASPTADAGSDLVMCDARPGPMLISLQTTGTGLRYAWSPSAGLSCSDCASPLANPDTTTMYRVLVVDDRGCTAIDSVMVWRSETTVPLSIEIVTATLGDTVSLAVVANSQTRAESVGSIQIQVRTDSTALLLLPDMFDATTLLSSTVLSGWTVTRADITLSTANIELEAPSGTTIHVRDGDTLIRIPARVLLAPFDPWIRVDAESPDLLCNSFIPAEGRVKVEFCGLPIRASELSIHPLLRPTVSYMDDVLIVKLSTPWTSDIKLDLYDLAGQQRKLLETLKVAEGPHTFAFDASDLQAGFYLMTMTSGSDRYSTVVLLR